MLEEFQSCIPDNIVVYLNEQKVASLPEAAVFVEEFALTHKGVLCDCFVSSERKSPRHKYLVSNDKHACFYCHDTGHLIANCLVLKKKKKMSKS